MEYQAFSQASNYDASTDELTILSTPIKLSLDGTLVDYLPELQGRIEHAERITLRMMVMHTSGIPNFTDQPEFNWGESNLDVLQFGERKNSDNGCHFALTSCMSVAIVHPAIGHQGSCPSPGSRRFWQWWLQSRTQRDAKRPFCR